MTLVNSKSNNCCDSTERIPKTTDQNRNRCSWWQDISRACHSSVTKKSKQCGRNNLRRYLLAAERPAKFRTLTVLNCWTHRKIKIPSIVGQIARTLPILARPNYVPSAVMNSLKFLLLESLYRLPRNSLDMMSLRRNRSRYYVKNEGKMPTAIYIYI